MPKIVTTSDGGSTIKTVANSHHYRFVGIEFKPVTGNFVYNLISIGNGETSAALLPNDIVFDRCYIHGDPSVGGRRGVAIDGTRVAVIDSYVSDFKEAGADTQAIWAYNTPGPLKIHLIGRETELQNLLDWARTRDAPSLMWLSGPAGIGKTRLAAELWERLAEENWTVGFIDIGTAPHFPEAPQGLLLVLDYPEENQAGTLAWLKALAGVPARPAPIRIVFLSRGGPNNPENDWTYQLRLARISYLCRAADHLGVLSASQCQRLVREVVYYAQQRIRYIMRGRSLCAVRPPPARVRSRAC